MGSVHSSVLRWRQVAAGKAAADQVETLSSQLAAARRDLEAAAATAEDLARERARAQGLEQRLARARQEAASASTLSADLEDRLRRAEDEIEAGAGALRAGGRPFVGRGSLSASKQSSMLGEPWRVPDFEQPPAGISVRRYHS